MKRNAIHRLPDFLLLIVVLALLFCRMPTAQASWLIDEEGFHASVHGRTSCLECHGDISKKRPHPDLANVNKALEDFFRTEQCEDCHVEAFEEIDEGTHGGLTDKSSEELEYCIGCHDPHYSLSTSAREAKVDLSMAAEERCSACHEVRDVLPGLSEEDEGCMGCHGRLTADDPKAAQKIKELCYHCHGTDGEGQRSGLPPGIALIDVSEHLSAPHGELSCLVCHPGSAQYGHADQPIGDCLQCHVRHDEKVTKAAHPTVSCQACHLGGVTPVRDADSGQVLWRIDREPDDVARVHHMVRAGDEEACRRCHVKGNSLGAAAMVLPAKSVICMPCHPSTLSVNDTTTIVSLLIFLVGFAGVGSVWLSGSLAVGIERREENRVLGIAKSLLGALFSVRLFSIIKALVLDGLLQRRLFRQSKARWTIHSLIFLPFVFRFGWGLVGLITSLCCPEWEGAWVLLDKNHPATAFLFDLTGAMVMLGIVCAVVRRVRRPSEEILPGLPRPDWVANGLLAGIILAGFLLEGMRIAMTGSPPGAEFAFVGYGLSRLFTGVDLTNVYGYMWYAHAILTGAFVAYLPFSRMIHMITVPISLALNSGSEHGHRRIPSPLWGEGTIVSDRGGSGTAADSNRGRERRRGRD